MSGMLFCVISFLNFVLPDLRMACAQTPVLADSLGTGPLADTPQPANYTRWGLSAGTCLNHSYGPAQAVFDEAEATPGYAHTGDTEWNLRYTHFLGAGSRQGLRVTDTHNREGRSAPGTRAQSPSAARVGKARELPASLLPNGLASAPRGPWPRAWT